MRLLAPLRLPAVALLWGGLSLSAIGDQLYILALSWIAVEVLGAAAGYLTALGAACVLATALLAGGWSDRMAPRRAMIGADLARAAVLVALVATWMATGRPSAAMLLLAVAVLGAGQAVFRPAMQAVLPTLLPERRLLPAANALFDTTERIARLLGPGLVGLLAAVVPARHFLSLDAASFLVSAAAVAAIARLQPGGAPPPAARPDLRGAILRGFRVVAPHPVLSYELATIGLINGAWFAAFFLALPLAVAQHHAVGPDGTGLGAYGLVISAYGATNLLATLVIGSRELPARPGRLVFAGNAVLGTGILLMGAAEAAGLPARAWLAATAAAAAFAAVGGPMHDIPVAVLRQTELPAAGVPAAMRAYLVVSNLGMLLGMLVAPSLFAALPGGAVFALFGAAILAVGITGWVTRGRARPAIP